MVSFRPLAAVIVMVAACVGGGAAQGHGQGPGPKPPSDVTANEKPKLEGINCTYGIACPIISIPVPEVPSEAIKPSPPRP